MKIFGFTLFETLIALTIVGIISAMTVPVLVNNHQKHVYETSLHKFYNDLDRAVENYMAEQHVDDLSESDLSESAVGLTEFVNKYFKIQKNCGTRYYENEGNSCFARYYKRLDGGTVDVSRHQCNIVFRTPNGMAICMDSAAMETVNSGTEQSIHSSFNNADGWGLTAEVDINGPQGPNIIGRDMFMGIAVTTAGKIVATEDSNSIYFNRILNNNWKMNY